jgi:predicted nucleic acid-binding protein
MVRGTPPDRLYEYWKEGRFELISCELQLEELNRVTRRPFFRERLKPSEAGRMVNDLRRLAGMFDALPTVERSPDADDDYLLALSQAVCADYLVTGDKSDLLSLERHEVTRIVTARVLVEILDR